MDAIAGEGVEVGRSSGHQRLAFTGLHFGDVAQVQGSATHQLDVEVTHAERARGRLTHGGEGFREEII